MKKISLFLVLCLTYFMFVNTYAEAQENTFEILLKSINRGEKNGSLVHIKNIGILVFLTEDSAEIIGVDKGGPFWWMLKGTVIKSVTKNSCLYIKSESDIVCTFSIKNKEIETLAELASIQLNEEIFIHYFIPNTNNILEIEKRPETRNVKIMFDVYYPPSTNYFQEELKEGRSGIVP